MGESNVTPARSMRAALLVSGFLLCIAKAQDDEYEYNDEGDNLQSLPGDDGDRLVGGKIAKRNDYPFLVGWNQQGMDRALLCTGSLISPTYFISAAHCNGILTDSNRENFEVERQKCVKATNQGGSHTAQSNGMSFQLKCKILPFHGFEIIADPPGKAYLGIEDSTIPKTAGEEMALVKRMIRHQDTYLGGAGYGDRGGYDIPLIEMQTPVTKNPACLPSPKFDDIHEGRSDSLLAGYGKYHRSSGATCQTNTYGLMKYHYCDKDTGKGSGACNTNDPPPMSPACQRFLKNKFPTDDDFPLDVEEIRLKTPKKDHYCYPRQNPESPDYGWCHTVGNYYNKDRTTDDKGWGYCGSECYLDSSEKDGGVLRKKDHIQIMGEDMCNEFLEDSFPRGKVKIRPKILCVGRYLPWKEEVWQQQGTKYRKVESNGPAERYGTTHYVTSAGTCNGDSGGPVFLKEGDKFVVTGATSGGRGKLGECGGINNPVHYARIKHFTRWIVENMGQERHELCWDEAFEAKLAKLRGRGP